jgi:hypothetical protein
MTNTAEDRRTFKGSNITVQINHWSEMHPHEAQPISMAPFNNRETRRHYKERNQGGYETGKSHIIPKEERQQAMNEPYRDPERQVRKAARAARKLARRG